VTEVITDWEKAWGDEDPYSGLAVCCYICRHFDNTRPNGVLQQCRAFQFDKNLDARGELQGGIPMPFIYSGVGGLIDHVTPFQGDNGIQFEPLTPDERIELRKKNFRDFALEYSIAMKSDTEIENEISEDVAKWLQEHRQ